jgi:hypothetical protein
VYRAVGLEGVEAGQPGLELLAVGTRAVEGVAVVPGDDDGLPIQDDRGVGLRSNVWRLAREQQKNHDGLLAGVQ